MYDIIVGISAEVIEKFSFNECYADRFFRAYTEGQQRLHNMYI